MSTIKTDITAIISLDLTDGEAGALAIICSYGPDIFLEWFEKNCGKSYIAPYKAHLKSLFTKARLLEYQVKKVEEYRKKFPKEIKI